MKTNRAGLRLLMNLGNSLIELNPATTTSFSELSADLVGFWRTQTVRTAVKVGVFEALPESLCQIAWKCSLNEEKCRTNSARTG